MNILLINHYAGSKAHGMEYQPFYLAREWTGLGHCVTIVATSSSHVRTVPPVTQGDYTAEDVGGISYVWLRAPGYRGNGVRRVLNIGTFISQLLHHRTRLIRDCRPDVVIASSTYPWTTSPPTSSRRSATRGWSTRSTISGRSRPWNWGGCRPATRSSC